LTQCLIDLSLALHIEPPVLIFLATDLPPGRDFPQAELSMKSRSRERAERDLL
jgi:hypothetical protein